jgi:hypothetical protein
MSHKPPVLSQFVNDNIIGQTNFMMSAVERDAAVPCVRNNVLNRNVIITVKYR